LHGWNGVVGTFSGKKGIGGYHYHISHPSNHSAQRPIIFDHLYIDYEFAQTADHQRIDKFWKGTTHKGNSKELFEYQA